MGATQDSWMKIIWFISAMLIARSLFSQIDVTPPQLILFFASDEEIYVSSNPVSITFTAIAFDDVGIDSVLLIYKDPNDIVGTEEMLLTRHTVILIH